MNCGLVIRHFPVDISAWKRCVLSFWKGCLSWYIPGDIALFVVVEITEADVLTPLTVSRGFHQNVWNLAVIVPLRLRSTSLSFAPPSPPL